MASYPYVIENWTYYVLGTILLATLFGSMVINGTIVYLYLKTKKLQTPQNTLIASLSLCFVGISVSGMPMIVISCFARKWIFGSAGYLIFGFLMLFLGLACIMILTMIALERYIAILYEELKLKTVYIVLFFCLIYTLAWSLCPVWGWGTFTMDYLNISCFISWENETGSDFSYLVTLLVMAWIVPLVIICFSYIKILITVKKIINLTERRFAAWKLQKGLTITVLLMIATFVISWSPYAVLAIWSMIGQSEDIPVALPIISELSMKTSMLWVPCIYIRRNIGFRMAIYDCIPRCCHNNSVTPSSDLSDSYKVEPTTRVVRRKAYIPRAPTALESDLKVTTLHSDVRNFLSKRPPEENGEATL